MAKTWTHRQMHQYLRGKQIILATSEQMGHNREYLTRFLGADPDARLSPQMAARILDAAETVEQGVS